MKKKLTENGVQYQHQTRINSKLTLTVGFGISLPCGELNLNNEIILNSVLS